MCAHRMRNHEPLPFDALTGQKRMIDTATTKRKIWWVVVRVSGEAAVNPRSNIRAPRPRPVRPKYGYGGSDDDGIATSRTTGTTGQFIPDEAFGRAIQSHHLRESFEGGAIFTTGLFAGAAGGASAPAAPGLFAVGYGKALSIGSGALGVGRTLFYRAADIYASHQTAFQLIRSSFVGFGTPPSKPATAVGYTVRHYVVKPAYQRVTE